MRGLATGAVYAFDGEDQTIFVFYPRKTANLIKALLVPLATLLSFAVSFLPSVASLAAFVSALVPFVAALVLFVVALVLFVVVLVPFVATLVPFVATLALLDRTAVANIATFADQLGTTGALLMTWAGLTRVFFLRLVALAANGLRFTKGNEAIADVDHRVDADLRIDQLVAQAVDVDV